MWPLTNDTVDVKIDTEAVRDPVATRGVSMRAAGGRPSRDHRIRNFPDTHVVGDLGEQERPGPPHPPGTAGHDEHS